MSKLEVAEELRLETNEEKLDFPEAENLIWDYAYGITRSFVNSEEECALLRKTIRSSGKNRYLKLKSYEPSVFSQIRQVSGLLDSEFIEEWDPDFVAQNTATKSAGKSGALFIISKNRRYFLKTLRKEEKDALKAMASDLAKHFTDYPASWLSRQYVLCRIEAQDTKQYFVIFNNLFSTPERTPTYKYDLKGAKVNRKSSAKDLAKPGHVRMDLDEPRTFPIDSDMRSKVLEQLNLDADFLERHNIMDYSLLVGLVLKGEQTVDGPSTTPKKSKKKKKHREAADVLKTNEIDFETVWQTGLPSASAPNEHYMFGIIDILQDYNAGKAMTHALKVVVYRTSLGLSTINASDYCTRFKQYMASNVITEHTTEEERS